MNTLKQTLTHTHENQKRIEYNNKYYYIIIYIIYNTYIKTHFLLISEVIAATSND